MAEVKDGGPAFPCITWTNLNVGSGPASWVESKNPGMSLRDWFAGQALSSAIQHELAVRSAQIAPVSFRYESVAASAYAMADAMLKARGER